MRQPFVLRPFCHLLVGALVLATNAGCGTSKEELQSVRVQIPWAGPDGIHSLQVVELKTLKTLSSFEGEAAQVRVDPFNASGDTNSMTPHFRYFRTRDGILVPTNFESLQMATAYAHMERLMELDKFVGAFRFLQWPRWIGILKDQSKTAGGGRIVNNAYYFSPKDMIVLAPYEKDDLPMTMNGGIIAHEHFHAIFQHMVLSDLKWESKGLLEVNLNGTDEHDFRHSVPPPKAEEKLASANTKSDEVDSTDKKISDEELNNRINVVLVRALNEGLADVWGWLYSGNENFIEPTLKELTRERTLSSSAKTIGAGLLPTDTYLRQRVLEFMLSQSETGTTVNLSYAVGTYFSRLMRGIFLSMRTGQKAFKLSDQREQSSLRERREWAEILILNMPKLAERIQTAVAAKKALSVNFLSEVLETELTSSSSLCETLKHFWLEDRPEKFRERICPQDSL